MLYVLTRSGLELLAEAKSPNGRQPRIVSLIQSTAAAQVMVAALVFTSSHVQIISRISSGYPLWYFWLARCLSDKTKAGFGNGFVMFMLMYAAIQGVLFASFLPPA